MEVINLTAFWKRRSSMWKVLSEHVCFNVVTYKETIESVDNKTVMWPEAQTSCKSHSSSLKAERWPHYSCGILLFNKILINQTRQFCNEYLYFFYPMQDMMMSWFFSLRYFAKILDKFKTFADIKVSRPNPLRSKHVCTNFNGNSSRSRR